MTNPRPGGPVTSAEGERNDALPFVASVAVAAVAAKNRQFVHL